MCQTLRYLQARIYSTGNPHRHCKGAGLIVTAERLIAVQDWRKHNVVNYAYGVLKAFVLCRYEGGTFRKNIETTAISFFGKKELPVNLAVEKCTREQILMCFEAHENPSMQTVFD